MESSFTLRYATLDDIPILVKHRRWMFEDMAVVEGRPHDLSGVEAMAADYDVLLHYEIPAGATRLWVIENEGKVVASGALKFVDWLPRPDGQQRGLVYVHSVYTAPEYRRQGLARRILTAMIEHCRDNGWLRITLHASDLGRELYEDLGFKPTNEMRLVLE